MKQPVRKHGRRSVGRGVSLPVEMWELVDKRVDSLEPKVTNLSHYIRILIDKDIKMGDESPFSDPEHQLVQEEMFEAA